MCPPVAGGGRNSRRAELSTAGARGHHGQQPRGQPERGRGPGVQHEQRANGRPGEYRDYREPFCSEPLGGETIATIAGKRRLLS